MGNNPSDQDIMNWTTEVLTSEFFWGIIAGLVLAAAGAAFSMYLDSRRRRKDIAVFCLDLIRSVSDLIQNLEDNRDRSRVIYHDFLGTIEAEIGVYARNREQLALLPDTGIRKEVRNFFTQAAAFLAQIKWRLGLFYEANNLAQTQSNPSAANEAVRLAEMNLREAHDACERLHKLLTSRASLCERLESLSKKVF